MCHFLKPLFKTHELSQKMIYSSEIWYGSCFFYVYQRTVKIRRRNRQLRLIFFSTAIPNITAVNLFLAEFIRFEEWF